MVGSNKGMILLNKRNIPYVPIIGLFMLIVSAIFFVFPQIFDADFDSNGLDEKSTRELGIQH